jgi:hypothetical protein
MSAKTLSEAVGAVVKELESFSSEDRHRIVAASLALLGEVPTRINENAADSQSDNVNEWPAKARSWMKQNGLSTDQISQVFHFGDEGPQIIAAVPGTSKKEQVRNAYVLCGIGTLLARGETKFEDKAARDICEAGGFFDGSNHMKYMKTSEFAGSKEKGWVLTAPGMKLGASLISQLGQV